MNIGLSAKIYKPAQQLQTRTCGKGSQPGVLSNPECAEYSIRQSQEKQVSLCVFAFRPAGWDNEKKIAILHENFTTVKPEDAYEDFIVKPPVRKVPTSITLRVAGGEFPSGPVVGTLRFHCQGPGFDPWSGN